MGSIQDGGKIAVKFQENAANSRNELFYMKYSNILQIKYLVW